MNNYMSNKMILSVTGIAIFAVMFCIGCYDLGIEPTVKAPIVTTFVDIRDGHVYKKEQIGDQIWMAENLNYAADGSVCNNNTYWNNPAFMCERYGRLYDWYTAMGDEPSSSAIPSGVEGVCPVGWHLPSYAEWKKLIDYVGLHPGTKLKSQEWHDALAPGGTPTPDGRDIYNFSALPGGVGHHHDGKTDFGYPGYNGYWWSSTEQESNENAAYVMEIMGTSDGILKSSMDKHAWFLSVRCVHD